MRVKELNNKVAHISFAPRATYPCYLASATASEQVESGSSVTSSLDLLKLDLGSPNAELEQSASVGIEARFNKLLWSDYSSSSAKDIIIGGAENSRIYLYDYEKILTSPKSSCVCTLDQHAPGGVFALDINPFQHNLLASGANSSEILVWDLNSPQKPMTPGAKLQPLEAIQCLSWNNQVQHILASTSAGGKCVVWDLRKNESIIKVSDSMSKMRAKLVAWNPDVATQMCLASDDDHTPQLQIWDLRFATAPVRQLEGHQRGVLMFNWYVNDANLLVSSSKDNRIICWNPNNPTVNGEILFDLPTPGQWCFDLSWCKRYPSLVASASLEGQINVYSLMGGRYNITQPTSSKIMDSFGVDSLTTSIPESPTVKSGPQFVDQLKLAPKWMKRSCGASFGFGGKLVTFGKFAVEQQHHHQQDTHTPVPANDTHLSAKVTVHQVVTDTKLVENSHFLENALQTGNFIEYCNYKIESAGGNEAQASIWRFIQAAFNQNRKDQFIELLGFNAESLNDKLKGVLKEIHADKVDHVSKELANSSLNLNGRLPSSSVFDNLAQPNAGSGSDNIQDDTDDTFNDIARSMSPVNLSFKNDIDNLITELLLIGRYENVVDLCIQEERFTDAILIGNFFDRNLLEKAQRAYFRHQNKNKFSNLLEKFLNRNWLTIISQCNLSDWREALASVLTYTQGDEQSQLLDTLGARLETNNELVNACICYICASNLDAFVQCWPRVIVASETTTTTTTTKSDSSATLQDLIEKSMILRSQIVNQQRQSVSIAKLNARLVDYAKLLADQGCFLNAYNYLKDSSDQSLSIIKDRVFHSLDPNLIQQYRLARPENPFKATANAVQAKSNVVQQSQQHNTQFNNIQAGINTSQARKIGYSQPTAAPAVTQYGANLGPNPTANALNTPFLPVNSVNHPMPTSALYGAQQSAAKPTPPFIPQQQQQPALTQPTAVNPSVSQTALNQNTNPNSSFFNPQTTQNPTAQTIQAPQLPSYMNTKPATAWNDPPLVIPKVKPVQPVKEQTEMPTFFQPTMPTAPTPAMYGGGIGGGVPTNQNQYYQPPAGGGVNMMNQFQQSQAFNPNQQSQIPQQQQQLYMPQQQIQQQAPPQQVPQRVEPEKPATPVPKAPIPAEHQIIATVFDNLLSKCHNSTNVPTVKRKLDDVGKKLELLYDKLRDSTLTPNVIQGLHTMVQYIQGFDYQSALALHSSLVATSNFSEISGFMPGVKVLIQSCQQMNITL